MKVFWWALEALSWPAKNRLVGLVLLVGIIGCLGVLRLGSFRDVTFYMLGWAVGIITTRLVMP